MSDPVYEAAEDWWPISATKSSTRSLGYGSYSTRLALRSQCYVSVNKGGEYRTPEGRNEFEREIFYTFRNGDLTHSGKRFVITSLDDFTLEGMRYQDLLLDCECWMWTASVLTCGTEDFYESERIV